VEDYASQCASTDNNRLNLAQTDIDRCSVEQFPINIRQTWTAPFDAWGQALDAFTLVGKDRGGLIVRSGGWSWFRRLG
jgi:hypothetical protein